MGMLILLGVHRDDTAAEAEWLARKCSQLRIFPNDDGRMDRSLLDVEGAALVVPQFTLYGDVAGSGNRPSFTEAAPPSPARTLYEYFTEQLRVHLKRPISTGVFGAMMQVHLTNDGPVTLWVERHAEES